MTTKVEPTVEKWVGDFIQIVCDGMIERLGLEPDGHRTWATTTDEIVKELSEELSEQLPHSVQEAKAEERGRIIAEIEKFKKVDNDCQHGPSDSCDSNCTYQHEHQDYNQIISDVLGKI